MENSEAFSDSVLGSWSCLIKKCLHFSSPFSLLFGRAGLVFNLCPTLVTPWTVAHQAPLSMWFSRKEYWNGLQFPSPGGIFPTQGSNLRLLFCRMILYHWATQEVPCLDWTNFPITRNRWHASITQIVSWMSYSISDQGGRSWNSPQVRNKQCN